MSNITYNWSEVDSSRQKLEDLISETEYLQGYPSAFLSTQGAVATSVLKLGEEVKSIKLEMNKMAQGFADFMEKAQITYENLEAEMVSSMAVSSVSTAIANMGD